MGGKHCNHMIVLRMFGLSAILGGSAWIRARVAAAVKNPSFTGGGRSPGFDVAFDL